MQYYTKENLPATIGLAIDAYGEAGITGIELYGEIDETHGFMVTNKGFYYCVNNPGVVSFENLSEVKIHKEHNKPDQLILVNEKTHRFDGNVEFVSNLANAISTITDVEVTYDMNEYDAVYFYGKTILEDIKDDVYEDTVLNDTQKDILNACLEDIAENESSNDNDYKIAMSMLGEKIFRLCEDLELDSEEIDELEIAVNKISETQSTIFDQARDMYNKNPDMIKNMTGIDPSDLKNKSPEELNGMLDDLCDRFNISKDQLMNLAAKFGKR